MSAFSSDEFSLAFHWKEIGIVLWNKLKLRKLERVETKHDGCMFELLEWKKFPRKLRELKDEGNMFGIEGAQVHSNRTCDIVFVS